MHGAGNPHGRSLAALAVVVGILVVLAAAVPSAVRPGRPSSADRRPPDPLVHSIALPDAWPAIPDGPNRPQFEALCRLCHSPRLVLTQPCLTEPKWAEVVHKMVAVYGAPIAPEQEREIVAYLTAIQVKGR